MVSRSGHCLNDLLYRAGAGHLPVTVAAYIRTPDGTATASVAAAVPSAGFDRNRVARHVQRAAEVTSVGLAAPGAE